VPNQIGPAHESPSSRSRDLRVEQERDGEGEEHERLDERQTENHRGLDAGSRAGVPADAFERRRGSLLLQEGYRDEFRRKNLEEIFALLKAFFHLPPV